MEIFLIREGDPYWEETIAFAQVCSWRAGPFLADKMTKNDFKAWERVAAAVEAGQVIGYCTFTERDELPDRYGYAPFIGFVFVDEGHRGHRVSGSLIARVLEYAGQLGYRSVYLMSGEKGLYEKYGFKKIGDFETVFGTVDQLFGFELRPEDPHA